MSEFNKTYRIRTEVGKDTQLHVQLDRKYDILEIMSLKLNQENAYKFHTSNYGVIAGRVLANDAFGVPNAKISVFINVDNNDSNDVVKNVLYPYTTTSSRNNDNIRYNLLPNEQVNDCYTIIGTFPEKQYTLDNGDVLEIYNKYYKYTTRTNEAGDYMIFGVPTGSQTIHVDIDLSDIGILSQRPRDMVNKGYNIEQFENANKFKHGTNLESLTQVISQDTITDVIPFWGDTNENSVGISRCDINISYKFEPTCVFMGSVVSDTKSDGISKKCIPTSTMGAMDELTTGSGTIEMIRKTPSGDVEEFQIKGTQLINGDGVWCYQIPMNLDYMMTDEFGNMVPTNDPKKGIPTRTQVRFRISLQDFETDESNIFRCKMLVPHNPDIYSEVCEDELDYQFGTKTKDSSFRDLYWNGIYSVKSYIPRIQKGDNPFDDNFTGFKRVNFNNGKNPIPYNNIRIRMPYAYTLACNTLKTLIRLNAFLNRFIRYISSSASFMSMTGEICNENLKYLCIIPGIDIKSMISNKKRGVAGVGEAIMRHYQVMKGDIELDAFTNNDVTFDDIRSNEDTNKDTTMDDENLPRFEYTTRKSGRKKRKSYADVKMYGIRVTDKMDYFIQCVEMKLANEFKVIQFDFYNDWINGLIYIPRWMRTISQKKHTLRGKTYYTDKIDACNENYKSGSLNLVQQCGLTYQLTDNAIVSKPGCGNGEECHKHSSSRKSYRIFKQNGLVRTVENSKSQFLYYFKPCETSYDKNDKNVRLFATDIILLGTLNECDKWGIPGNISELVSTTYQMPPNIALTDSEANGVDYGANIDKEEFISMEYSFNKERVTSINLGNCYVGINPIEDISNYTELAGVSWDYTGPLQHAKNGIYGKLYRPGGHFLGMACNNVATNIKSCVNLSRICEYGVWMSQRQRLIIPTDNNVEFYGIVPSGFISKDEISGTNYRRLFATMNKNRLRTKINPETGYPIYDFKYVNPTNFGGDMAGYFNYNELYRTNMNRLIDDDGIIERYYDSDYIFGKHVLTRELKTNEKQIMRTGEFKDDEYLNYRFGLEGSYEHDEEQEKEKGKEKMKRFLIHENKTKHLSIENGVVSGVNFVSFPMYENSFYFYFGMHDGKTAIDEFKRTYYAVCKKNNDLVQINNSVELSDVNITYDGICESEGKGALNFNIKADDNLFNGDGFNGQIFNDSGYNYDFNIKDKTTTITVTGLTKGVYYINITHGLLANINETFTLEVKSISLNGSVTGSDFIKFIDDKNKDTFNETDKETNGGYIKVNRYVYYENDGKTDKYDIFNDNFFKSLKIEFDNGNSNVNVTVDQNHTILICEYNGIDITMEINEGDEEYKIPIPFVDTEYTVKLTTLIDNCKLPTEIKYNLSVYHEWNLGKVKVFNANRMDLFFNKVHWEILKDYVFDKEGNPVNWWQNIDGNDFGDEDGMIKWYLKEALFQNEAGENAKSNPHTIPIAVVGGKAPYKENLSGVDNDNESFVNASRFDYLYSITAPSIVAVNSKYPENMSTRDENFKYHVEDVNGQKIPENGKSFEFPSIYKPFYLDMITWHSKEGNINFYGNIWNGITWTMDDGFNDIVLNGKKFDENITVKSHDITFFEYPDSETFYSSNRYEPFSLNISEKEKADYGLYNDKVSKFDLKIGSSHQEDIEEVTYDFSNHTRLKSNNIYYAKIEKGVNESGDTIFNISNLNPDMYSIYLVDGNGDFSVTNLKNALPHIDNGGDKDYWFNLLLNDNYIVEVNGNNEKLDFYNHPKTVKMAIKNGDKEIIDKGDRDDIEFIFDKENKVYSAKMIEGDFTKHYFVVVLDKNKINAKDVLSYTTNSLSQLTAFSISDYIE